MCDIYLIDSDIVRIENNVILIIVIILKCLV